MFVMLVIVAIKVKNLMKSLLLTNVYQGDIFKTILYKLMLPSPDRSSNPSERQRPTSFKAHSFK